MAITAVSTPFVTMVEGVEHTIAWAVTMTLPGGVYPDVSLAVESFTIEQTTNNTDVPDQTRYEEGTPGTEATLVLSGLVDPTDETKTAAWLFRRWNAASPLALTDALNAEVTIDCGLYPAGSTAAEVIRKATMWVDDYTTSADGTVTFTLKDRWSQLRALPQSGAVVTTPPYNAGLTSEYAIDALLRSASAGAVSSWPAAGSQCVLSAGFRSSTWAETGTLLSTWLQPVPVFAPGLMGTALTAAAHTTSVTALTSTRYALANSVQTSAFVEFWAKRDPADGAAGLLVYLLSDDLTEGLAVIVGATNVTVWDQKGGTAYNTAAPADAGWHYYAVKATLPAAGGTAVSGTVYIDGATHAFTSTLGAARAFSNWTVGTVGVTNNAAGAATIEALRVTTETSPVTHSGFVPQAVLDPSLSPLTVVPAIDADTQIRDVIGQICAAELAVAWFDEGGIFRFWNRRTLADVTVARSVTSATALTDLNEQTLTASVINRAALGYIGWKFAAAGLVYTLTGTHKIPANQVYRLTLKLDGFAAAIPGTASTLGNGHYDDNTYKNGGVYYRASNDAAGNGVHTFNAVTVVQTQADTVVVTFDNTGSSRAAWLVSTATYTDTGIDAGDPSLWIGGSAVTQLDEVVTDYQYPPAAYTWPSGLTGAAGSRFGEQPWQDSGNPWRQDADATMQLATDVVTLSCVPAPNLTGLELASPDPRLQIGDLVHVSDPDTTGVDEYARIFGQTLTYSASDRSHAIDGKTLGPPFAALLGIAGRSELGTNFYLYA